MKYLSNQNGIVGLVALGLVLLVSVGIAASYVYQVRNGKTDPITATIIRQKVPEVVKEDPDAAAAESAGEEVDNIDLNDLTVSEEDLQ